MTTKRLASFIVALTLYVSLTVSALARPAGREVVESTNSRLRGLLGAKAPPEKITSEMRNLFDIGDLARRALVDHWDTMTATQRQKSVETLRAIVEKNYVSQLKSNLKYEVKYVGEEPKGEDTLVKTVVQAERKGRPFEISVDYLLHPEGNGWKVYDIITDEVSLLRNYRSQFNRIISKDGVDGLIKRMNARLEKGDAE
jgi:phospholipid transport system substrate-binding protein